MGLIFIDEQKWAKSCLFSFLQHKKLSQASILQGSNKFPFFQCAPLSLYVNDHIIPPLGLYLFGMGGRKLDHQLITGMV